MVKAQRRIKRSNTFSVIRRGGNVLAQSRNNDVILNPYSFQGFTLKTTMTWKPS